jgi:hypothetical protein
MLILLSGLTKSTITLILTVIRTSRLSYTIRNVAQGKRSSGKSTSLLVIRTVFRISTSIMFGALHKTLQLGMSRTALLLVLQLANSRGSLLITNNRNTSKLIKVKKLVSRIMILMSNKMMMRRKKMKIMKKKKKKKKKKKRKKRKKKKRKNKKRNKKKKKKKKKIMLRKKMMMIIKKTHLYFMLTWPTYILNQLTNRP